MGRVLIDACGWVAVIDGRINIDTELNRVIGMSNLAITARVRAELESLQQQNTRRRLLLSLLDMRAEVIESEYEEQHTDEEILAIALQRGWPVLTVDRALKNRLHDANCSVIEVVAGSRLELIE